MTSTPIDSPILKAFIACLIISLLILGPVAQLSLASPGASSRVETATSTATPAAPVPLAPAITATKVDSFSDPDANGKAEPGDTITYDVNITNSGTDATGVNFSDTIDPNTTLVGGSLKVSPLAFADTYSAAKDTPLSVGAPGVLTNDTGVPGPTAVAIGAGATAQGGIVTLNTDGSFTYNPAAGFTGTDSFNYTITNGLPPNDTATVSIVVDAPPSVTSTTPANGASNQAVNTNISVTFSEPVNVSGNWFQISCTSTGTRNVVDTVVTGGPTTFNIDPNADFAQNETCTITVFAAQVSDQDANDPPDNMTADFVFSFSTQDAAPSVTSTTPTNGATNQTTNSNIDVTFNEPVNVTGNWFQIVCGSSGTRNVADTVVTGGPTTFTINPNTDFSAGETCTVTIFAAQVTDQDSDDPPDNMAANFVFSFSTETAPTVNATTPTNGATGVADNTDVTITFSEPVDVTGNWFQLVGATSGTRNVADTVVTGGPTTFTINPNVDFANGELVTVTVFAAQVTDQDTGDPPDNMAANFVFSFTIDQAPSVTATTPTNGATNVALNSNLSITFSEPVNVTGNWFQIVCPTTGTRNVADTVVSGGPTTFTINPNADFTFNEACTVTVFAAQVSDQDSGDPPDNMTANFVFSFTTVDAAPTVTSTTPTNGALNQTTNTNIDITFSEPVNVTGNWFQIVCTSSGTRNVVDTVVTGGPTTFTINPNTNFTQAETCTMTIFATQVTDQDTNDPPDNMAANFVFSFSMDAQPSVTATTPTNNATQQANNTNISVTFSEPVNVTGNWFQIVGSSSGTRSVADTVVTGGPTTFTINPNTDFTNGETVTITVFAAQVADQDANDPPDNMAANFVFSFTIDVPPSVTSTVPTNNAINVSKSANIIVNFSENVSATTSSFTIECPAPGNLRTFTVSGSGTNQITLDPTVDLPQGVICTVTVIANQISDTDTGDPPDNMTSNFAFSFGVQPEAVDDARNGTGNIQIQTAGRSNFSVLTNDIGPGVTVTTADTTSLRGGNVSVAANGTFSYNPPAGYEGTDSFNYTISNAAGSDVGTVVITIAGMIWFVNNQGAACTTINGTCGRLTNPFSTLAAFDTANGNATPVVNGDVTSPEAGDHLFIYTGVGNYTGPVTLENNQRVIGQGATSSLQTLSSITPATDSDAFPSTGGTKPSITTVATSGNNGFNLASGNQLYGLAFSNTDGAAIRSSVNVGTLVMSDLVINNTGGGGIILTNGGTVTISGTNTIVTTSGTALNVSNTTIAAAGITFQSISSNGGSNTGIILDTTGSSGGLTVTGDGTNTSLGGNSTGGTIGNKAGADGGTTTGNAIYLNSTSNVVLRRMTINGTNQNFGIRGTNVNGVTLEFSTISGSQGTSTGADEGSIIFDGLTGTSTFTKIAVSASIEDNFRIRNSSGTADVTITGSTFTNAPNDNLIIEPSSTANVTAHVTNNTFTGAGGDHFQASTTNSATLTVVFTGNLYSNGLAGSLGGGITISGGNVGSSEHVNFNISNNGTVGSPLVGNVQGGAINVNEGQGAGTWQGQVSNNIIGNAAVVNSGSAQSSGIRVENHSTSGTLTAIINGNTVRQWNNGPAINTQAGDAGNASNTGVLNVTVTNNTATNPGASSQHGFVANIGAGSGSGTAANVACVDVRTNTLDGNVANGGAGVRTRQREVSTVKIPGYTGTQYDITAVATLLQTNNPGSVGPATASTSSVGPGYTNTSPPGSGCPQPTVPSGPLSLLIDVGPGTVHARGYNTTIATARGTNPGLGLAAGVPSSADDIDVWAAITGNDFSASSPAAVNVDVLIGVSGSASSIRLPGYSGTTLTQVQTFIRNNQLNAASTVVSAFEDNGNGATTPSFISGAAFMSPSAIVLPVKSSWRDTLALKRSTQEPPSSAPASTTATKLTSAKQTIEPHRPVQQTLSHHAKIANRNSVTPATFANNRLGEQRQVNVMQQQGKTPRGGIIVKPRVVPQSAETVTHSIGTLLGGKTVHIQFQVTVNTPYLGGAFVSNQGTVSSPDLAANVLTDDPAVGGANDPTQTPILLLPNISVADAQANEPASGSAPMLFTVSLSSPAPAGGASVHYQTADEAPAPNHAVAGVDYTAVPDTVLNFAAGEQFKTVSVNILADGAAAEADETFLLNLSNPTNAAIVDGQATGTIKQGNASGTFLISELRTSGPGGAGDDFVELYNNSDSPLTIAASDASSGYGLFKMGADCNATPILIGTIPNGTVIPARGHYLFVGSAYSLANYGGTGAAAGDQTLTSDIESDRNVAIFNTASLANLSSVTRLDAVGFGVSTGGICDLLREGTTLTPLSGSVLEYTFHRDSCGKKGNPAIFGPCPTGDFPTDTNNNANDFIFADTQATVTPAGQRLGAPGPENLSNPRLSNNTISVLLLDSNFGGPAPPNRFRDLTPSLPNAQNGTMSVRRRFVNNTGAPVTRLRFRIVDISSIAVPGGIADVRALTSTNVVVNGITDAGTCLASTGSATTPCTITVLGTTLETPPAQPLGGANNSSMSAGTITLATPLAPGASINLQFLLGVQQTGSFKFFFNIEALNSAP
jgi:methionine-rich copper-binding protein CopC